MKTIRVIAIKEVREIFRDGRFRAASATVLVLLLAAFAAGWKHQADVDAQHRAAQMETREQWVSQGEKNPHSAAHYGVYAFLPRNMLSMVDTGVYPYTGVAVWLEAHRQNGLLHRPAQDGTTIQRFGQLTAATVLQLLIPLMIILLAFGAYAGERERGTLTQLFSLGIDRRKLAVGKALGVSTALAMLLVPAAFAGVAALMSTSGSGELAGNTARILAMAAAYLLYFGVFVALSIGISAWTSSSRSALLILLSFWIANGLVAPRLVSEVAATVWPTPSSVEFNAALDADLADRTEMDAELERVREELLAAHGVSDLSELPVNFLGLSFQAGEDHANAVFDEHWNGLFDTFERQNGLQKKLSFVAPVLAIRSLSMALAGADFSHHRDFVDAAEGYRRDLQRRLNAEIESHPVAPGETYLADAELWEAIPTFEYRAPGVGWVLRNHVWSLVVLGVWFGVSILACSTAARRVRPV